MFSFTFNSEVIQFIKQTAVFVLLTILFCIVLNGLRSHYNAEPVHYKLHFDEIYHPKTNANCIILGTSHSSNAVIPTMLSSKENTFYNFALNGSNPVYYRSWFGRVFQPNYPKPKLCLLEYNWLLFDSLWLNRTFIQDAEHYSAKLFKEILLTDSSQDFVDLVMNRFPVFKYRKGYNHLENLVFSRSGSAIFPKETFQNGYIAYRIPSDSIHWSPPTLNNRISIKQVEAFGQLLSWMQMSGIETILFSPPEYAIAKEHYFTMNALKLIDSMAMAHNLIQLNYNTTLRTSFNQDSLYFADWGHLSEVGARVFTNRLKHDLDSVLATKNY